MCKFYLNGKKVSAKVVKDLVGAARLEQIKQEAQEAYYEDPNEEVSFMVPGGMLVIRF